MDILPEDISTDEIIVDPAIIDQIQGNRHLIADNNVDLRINRLKEEGAWVAREISRLDSYPNLMVGVDYIETGSAVMAGVPDSGKDPVMVSASIEIPLNRRQYQSAIRESDRRLDAIQSDSRQSQLDIEAALAMVSFRLNDAMDKILLFDESVLPDVRETLGISEQRYRSGELSIDRLIDDRKKYIEITLLKHRAVADLGIQISEFDFLSGGTASFSGLGNVQIHHSHDTP